MNKEIKPIDEMANQFDGTRIYFGYLNLLLKTIAAAFSLFFVLGTFVRFPFEYKIPIFIAGTLVLIFIYYPASNVSPKNYPSIVDLILILMTILPTIYYIKNYEVILIHGAARVSTKDVIYGLFLSIACLEGCRRMIGWTLPAIAIVSIGYCYFGYLAPGLLAHSGFSLARIMRIVFGQEGIYGIVARTYSIYMIIFIILGAFLKKCGVADAFINLSLSLFGRKKGGAAKVAVLSSAITGSIIGSGAANVVLTGTFTIPLMKKTGFEPEVAAAVETVASTGGGIMPPVMGAAIFLMASFTGLPYTYIISISLVPAILFYLAVFSTVHFYSEKHENVKGIEKQLVPSLKKCLKEDGSSLIPVLVIVVALIMGFTPFRAGVFSLISAILVGFMRKKNKICLNDIFDALFEGTLDTLMIGSSAGVMGILLGTLVLPGAPIIFSSWAMSFSRGNLLVIVILSMITSFILGMGMTISAAYVMIIIVALPALLNAGLPLAMAHLIVIWFSQTSTLTPPFCLNAFVAAGIARSNPMKTGWTSLIIGIPFILLPYAMVYTPLLGLDGIDLNTIITWITLGISLVVYGIIYNRYCFYKLKNWELFILILGALLLFLNSVIFDTIGIILIGAILVPQYIIYNRNFKMFSEN